jgi:hypothetical protein
MEKDRVDYGRKLFYNIYHSGVLERIKKVIFTEKFLYSELNLFAGTTDFGYLDFKNTIVITDFKSASTPRTEDVIDKYKCQAAAYTIAFEEMYKKPIGRCEIWISHLDGLQLIEIDQEEIAHKKIEFLELVKCFHATWETEPFKKYAIDI